MDSGEDIIKANMKALEEADEKGEEVVLPFDEESALKEPEKPVEDDKKEVVAEVEDEPKEPVDEPDADEQAELAKKDGYMSKEDWIAAGKPADEYMSEEDFVKVGELRDGGESKQQLAKKLVQMETALKDVANNQRSMIEKAEEDARQSLLTDLEAQKKEAIEFQDASGAADIERKIVEAEKTKPAEAVNEPNPALDTWYKENDTWYNIDANATSALNVQLQKHEKAGLPFEEGIELAMTVVKKHFPYHFDDVEATNTTKKDIPTRVPRGTQEQSQKKVSQKKGKTFADLPDSERAIAKQGAKMANMTESEYMENY